MDPLSALSLATNVVTFIDFGAKLVSLYLDVRKSNAGSHPALSALKTESRELLENASHARTKIAVLQARYPRQSESLARLAAECTQAEKDLQSLADTLTAKPAAHHGLGSRGAQALIAMRGMRKQGDIQALQGRLKSIREQLMMSVIMCIADDATENSAKLAGVDNGVGEVLDLLRPIKTAIANLQPEFTSISQSRPLATVLERDRMANGLWTSITTAEQANQAGAKTSPSPIEEPLENDRHILGRILRSLEFEDMTARESQIENPFPKTFRWLLDNRRPRASERSATPPPPPTRFKEWLESQANATPFWITGNPASGKSTLMKFIVTNPEVRTHLQLWSGDLRLLTCSVYFWNPGSSAQKSQLGLLSTILHQLLRQRPDLCRRVVFRRHLYFQLAGPAAPDPPEWTLDELRDCVIRFVSQIEGTDRLALFVDGLDEYEGDLDSLISFLNRLHRDYKVKLCVSSRPLNAFKDEFRTYPSLRMELLTKSDIAKYVCTRIRSSPAFQELRGPYSTSVEKLESQIIEKAEGVFLWVVLVVEKILTTARENNDLREIWRVFDSLPPGLEKLYASMRKRLDPAHRKSASRMYQLLFRWNEIFDRPFGSLEFWMAINCHDPTAPQPCPRDGTTGILPVLERRLAGATGGILQVHRDPSGSRTTSVGFLHRTVFEWLQSIRSVIENDGPANYDLGLVLTSVLVSRLNFISFATAKSLGSAIRDVFDAGQSCNHSPEVRAKLLRIIDQFQVGNRGEHYLGLSERAVLSFYPDSAIRSFLAVRFCCTQYLQAKLESTSRATGLELPRKLHIVPSKFWTASQKGLLSLILEDLLRSSPLHGPLKAPLDLETRRQSEAEKTRLLTMRLETFEVLQQARFAPNRVLRARIKQESKHSGFAKEFWSAIQVGFKGGPNQDQF